MWISKPLFVGAHFWFAPIGQAFTSPAAGNITQMGAWPDVGEANWTNWALGTCESFEIDPKPATGEVILTPLPGTVQATDKIIPYATPEVMFTLLYTDALAVQLALNTQKLFQTGVTQFNPNGGGSAGARGILKAQKYDQDNNLILNFQSWVIIELKSGLKGAPKTMTKPEYTATLLYSPNNTGSV